MNNLLEGATALSICKLLISLPFLRSVVFSCSSPVSFCCHCLLLFTDVVLTVFFGALVILQRWQIVAPSTGDTIALRCLLFICHTYGAVFLLTLPEIIVDTLVRHLRQQGSKQHQNTEPKDQNTKESEKSATLRYHVVAYFCCLSLWIFGTINIRLRWKMEEIWTAACLYSTNSLSTCLPNFYSPMMRVLPPCWTMALFYIVVATAICICLLRSENKQSVRLEIAVKCIERDVGLSPAKNNELKDYNRTEKVIRLTLAEERKAARPQCGSGLGAEVMIGVVCILAMFVLPLHLTVNIHLISTVEKIAERVKDLVLSRSPTLHNHIDMV